MQSWQNIRNTLKFLALLTVVSTVTGTALYYYSLRTVIIRDGRREAAANVLAVETRLSEGFARNLRTVKAIAGDIEVRNAVRGTRENLGGTREHLLFYRRTFGFISCTLLDRDGKIITSTDPSGALWQDGASQAPRPWLEAALAGDQTVYMMPGKAARQRRVVFSQPVYDAGGSPAGVVFIETGTDAPAKEIGSSPEGILILSSNDGYIFLSSRASLLDRLLWIKPVEPGEDAARESRFGAEPDGWSGLAKQSATEARDSAGRRYDIYERGLTCCDGWAVTYLHDREAFMAAHAAPFFGKAWYAFVGFGLAVILAALGFYRAASRDIGVRQAAEALRVESEKSCRAVNPTAKDAIFTVAEDDTVVARNEAKAALFGLPKGKAPFPIAMSPSDWETGGRSFSSIVVREISEERLPEAKDGLEPMERKKTKTPPAARDGEKS